jgi:hypothetical protein
VVDFNEMFGTEPRPEKAMSDLSEGFQAGVLYAATLQEEIRLRFADRSREYREGIAEGIRDAL